MWRRILQKSQQQVICLVGNELQRNINDSLLRVNFKIISKFQLQLIIELERSSWRSKTFDLNILEFKKLNLVEYEPVVKFLRNKMTEPIQ